MLNVIYIMWLRQIKRYLRAKSRIIGSIGQPLLFLLAMGYGIGPIYAKAGGGNYLNFISPGIIGQAILSMAVFNGVELIWDRQFGFLKETLVAPVSRLEIILGRVLGGTTIALFQGIIVFILSLLFGFKPINLIMFPVAIALMFLISLLYTSLGTAIASTMKDFHGFQLIMNFLVSPTFFLSGALFPLTDAPKTLKTISTFNPLTYGVDGLRQVLTGVGYFSLGFDFIILGSLSLILLFISSYLFSKIEV